MADRRRVFSDLGCVRARLEAAVNRRLQNEFGLPLVMYETMTVIEDVDFCRVHDLAARLSVSAGNASKADRLCALGYCRRLPNPGDRRSSLLRLAPAGQVKLAAAGQAVDQELEWLLGPVLSAAQVRELAAILQGLRLPARSDSAGPSSPLPGHE